jgi:2-haloacid dehalogenase
LAHPDKAATLMVGDSLTSDIAGGRAYGIDTAWYNPDARNPRPGDTFTYEIRDLSQLLTLV